MLNGTDPNSVHSYRCDSSEDFIFSVNITKRDCNTWHNSTYGNMNKFMSLNNTDSDVLMPRNLARYNYSHSDHFDINNYFVGATGLTVIDPTIHGGIATLPHATGVNMIIGVPELSAQQKVTIPKTMAIEVEIGCSPLGTYGNQDTSSPGNSPNFFVPDERYKTLRGAKYTGPSHLKSPLEETADAIRDVLRPWFNSSHTNYYGDFVGFNRSYDSFDWQTSVHRWDFSYLWNGVNTNKEIPYILGNCTQRVDSALSVTSPPASTSSIPVACSIFQLRGSFFYTGSVIQGHLEMVCAASTSIDMVSAQLEVDAGGLITSNLTRIPSDLNIVYASYYDIVHGKPGPGDTTWFDFDPILRFTLSENPSGALQHFIFQQEYSAGATANMLTLGAGSGGCILSRVASSILGVSSRNDATLSVVNANYFSMSENNFSTAIVTKWAGGVGASYLLASLGYHGGAALGKEAFIVQSTGGQVATCYNPRYAIAFLPLILSITFILLWYFHMFVSATLRGIKKIEEKYGGLAPVIFSPLPGRPTEDTVLAWDDNGDHSHLHAMIDQYSLAETEMLVSQDNFIEGDY